MQVILYYHRICLKIQFRVMLLFIFFKLKHTVPKCGCTLSRFDLVDIKLTYVTCAEKLQTVSRWFFQRDIDKLIDKVEQELKLYKVEL